MKKLALALATSMLLAACSSGSSEAPIPENLSSQFAGNYRSNNNIDSGQIRFNLVEDADAQSVSGSVFFTPNPNANSCLRNAQVTGLTTGFNLTLTSSEITDSFFTITTVITRSNGSSSTSIRTSRTGTVGTTSSSDGQGNTTTVTTVETTVSGTIEFTLTQTNNGVTLSGTYLTTGDICSNQTGSGTVNLTQT